MGEEIGDVLGSSEKYINELKLGFDTKIETIFLLNPLKDLNMTGFVYQYWGLNSDILIMENFINLYW